MSRQLTIYIRPGCHLCGAMLQELNPRREVLGFGLRIVDITGKPELESLYGAKVPVLANAKEEICHYFFDEAALKRCFEDG